MRVFIATAVLGVLAVALMRPGVADDKTAPPGAAAKPGQPNQPGQAGQPAGPRFDAERFIKDHDKNGDGKLSKDELPPDMQEHFADVDTNKDGFVTAQELQAHADRMAQQRPYLIEIAYYVIDVNDPAAESNEELQKTYDLLRKLDTNKDGKLDAKEIGAFREERKKERADRIFKYMDKNGDGKISKDEARGLWADHFKEMDTNNDGFLDRTEVEKALMTAATHKTQPDTATKPQR
jgi:Ca2+-binding EF-hand superfamily protein